MHKKQQKCISVDYVVVGGGVAGVCCVDELRDLLDGGEVAGTSQHRIAFITGSEGFVKRVANAKQIGQLSMAFDVESADPSDHFGSSERITLIQSDVVSWKPEDKTLYTRNGIAITYRKLAICCGASARCAAPAHPRVLRLRDLQTIKGLENALRTARRALLIGNGGIATELAFELKNIELVWAIRHSSISATYFDIAAAKFFEPCLNAGRGTGEQKAEVRSDSFTQIVSRLGTNLVGSGGWRKRARSDESFERDADEEEEAEEEEKCGGSALGPHWLAKLAQDSSSEKDSRQVFVVGEVQLLDVSDQRPASDSEFLNLPEKFLPASTEWPVWAKLSDGRWLGANLIIEATGAVPNSRLWSRDCPELRLADDGGILVDERMMTNVENVFAAGDVCTAGWADQSPHWKQIRLWTQARQMGMFCARCMLVDNVLLDIAFELFTHVTTFFGYKVVLLGDFVAEKLTKPYEQNYRITEGSEYIKVLTKDHRVHGAVLIGETEMEEALENLILNQTDISQIEADLLDPNIDLEDFFD